MHPQVARLMHVPQYEQRTPAWYEVRKSLMTASNAAAALGIKPFASFTGDARKAAIDQIVSGSFKGNVATRHGCQWEDWVRDRFAEIVHEDILEFGLIKHPSLHWLAASPDGICSRSGAMVEIKCPYRRRIVPGKVPGHYMPQMQTQMEVCDLDFCYFVQWQPARLNPDRQEIFDIVLVQRDKQWFTQHKDALYSFWKDLMEARRTYVPPPPPPCLIVDDLYDS